MALNNQMSRHGIVAFCVDARGKRTRVSLGIEGPKFQIAAKVRELAAAERARPASLRRRFRSVSVNWIVYRALVRGLKV